MRTLRTDAPPYLVVLELNNFDTEVNADGGDVARHELHAGWGGEAQGGAS